MKSKLKLLALTSMFCVCALTSGSQRSEAQLIRDITHYNVIIVPDLSNRLNRSTGLKDVTIVDSIVHNIYPKVARFNRATGQKDRYSIVFSSTKLGNLYKADLSRMQIDLGAFKNDQKSRIEYVTGRNPVHNLQSDVASFTLEFARIEMLAKQKTSGADIWSFMNAGLDQNLMMYPEPPVTFNKQQYRNIHRNIVILLTDGYIEAGLSPSQGCDGKQCRYLSGQLIAQFRQAYKSRPDRSESLQAFFNRNRYGITPANNPQLRGAEVLVLEADDRSLTKTGNSTFFPTDFEIMRLFWEDWMKKSGVRHFEVYPVARDAKEARDRFLSFIGIP
jgi:hypothetical protein